MPEEHARSPPSALSGALTTREAGIVSGEAKDLPDGAAARSRICKRVYRNLMLTGYGRIDLRLSENGSVYVMEANPNPQLARDEDFAQAARAAGVEYGPLLQRILTLGVRWEPTRVG